MNNAILYFFDINPLELKKINDNYYFKSQNSNYVVYLYDRNIDEALEIYYLNLELLNNGLNGYIIVLTKNNEVLFMYSNKYYVLMRIPNIKNRTITFSDILLFRYIPNIKIKLLDKSNWSYNWSGKIDFIEYQFEQIKNKYPLIEKSIHYFIGIWENGISYMNENYRYDKEKVVCHKRITTDMDILQFLNPINFVIDYLERDIGDYLKSFAFSKNYSIKSIEFFLKRFDRSSIILIISRLLFPSYYFDIYEDIVLDKVKEDNIEEILKKKNNVLKIINIIFDKYSNYNITSIFWIKKEIS